MTSRVRMALKAVRSPQVEAVRNARLGSGGVGRVSLVAGRDPTTCIARLRALGESSDAKTVLVIPSGSIGPRVALPAIQWLVESASLTLGLPGRIDKRMRKRWSTLAGSLGLDTVTLGERGWDRVDLGSRSEILGYVDIPAELGAYERVVLLAKGRRQVMSDWRALVHPNSALRAWASGAAGSAELSMAVEARYVLLLESGSTFVVIDTSERVAAQIAASGWSRVAEETTGVEAEGPWEEDETQALVALASGIVLPSQLTIRAHVAGTGVEHRVERLAELIGCRLEWSSGVTI